MTTEVKPRPLTKRRAAFVREWPKDRNATQAAIRAGFSEQTAGQAGSRLLKDVQIQAALTAAAHDAASLVAAERGEAVDSAAWIIRNAVETHAAARADGQYGPAVAALALLAKRHPEFRDQVVDQSQHLSLSGLTQEQLDAAILRLEGPKA